MKSNLKFWLAGICSILIIQLFQSCEDDVQVVADPEFIPVVYCLLDPQDTIQTVRVSRVFQSRDQFSAWENLYDGYLKDSINKIYLEQIDDQGEHEIWKFSFDKQIRQANDSVFVYTCLYTSPCKPSFSTTYQLYAYFPETKTMVSSKIKTLSKIQLFDPAVVPGRKMVIDPTQPYVIRWMGATGTGFYQNSFLIHFLEEESGQITGKTISMPSSIFLPDTDVDLFSLNVGGMRLLQTLKSQIPVKDGVRRKLTTLDFTFYFGGHEIALFANSGMNPKGPEGTVVDFTNFDNARGVFSSMSLIQLNGLSLCDQSTDTIAMHSLTKNLNFLSSHEDF